MHFCTDLDDCLGDLYFVFKMIHNDNVINQLLYDVICKLCSLLAKFCLDLTPRMRLAIEGA